MFKDGFEYGACPRESGFGGADGDVEHDGDLLDGAVVHIEEADNLAELGVERFDRSSDHRAIFRMCSLAVEFARLRPEFAIVGSLTRFLADPIAGFV